VGIYICSPDVLARFSDEFDFLTIDRFISNSVAEEEEGLQSKLYASLLEQNEYAARIHDPRILHAVSQDLLRRWCYPIVPDNLPSGYEKTFRYEMSRSCMYMECKEAQSKVGRSSVLKGPGMVGSRCVIGEHCVVKKSVIGNGCSIANKTQITESHLWENVTIESNTTIIKSIICNDVIIKSGAVVPRGCIIGRGCVIGEDVVLKEFSRITLCKDLEDEDGFDGFDSDDDDDDDDGSGSGSGSSSNSSSSSSSDNSSNDEGSSDNDENKPTKGVEFTAATEENTDHDIVGKDGLGRLWLPIYMEDDDIEDMVEFDFDGDTNNNNDDEEEDDDAIVSKRAMEIIKSQSIGYDASSLLRKRETLQEEVDNLSEGEDDDSLDDEYGAGSGGTGSGGNTLTATMVNVDEDGMPIMGRQAGIDVVKELKTICLDHETSSPVENLRIELNAFKFSQNATFGDCVHGAILAILDKLQITKDITAERLMINLKRQLGYWGELLDKLMMSMEEEKSVMLAIESAAMSDEGVIGPVIRRDLFLRVILQTLFDEDVISKNAILEWASMRQAERPDSSQALLFTQKRTQEFLQWLEEDDSDSDSDSSSDGSSSSGSSSSS